MTRDDYYWATDAAAAFMRARLEELRAAATAAKASLSGHWHVDSEGNVQDQNTGDGETAAHIIINDPATVLASVAADRLLLDAYAQAGNVARPNPADSGYLDGIAYAVRCRASAWANDPGYKQEWRP